jgi:glycosyltransferase involved in cell wall biosynthesis
MNQRQLRGLRVAVWLTLALLLVLIASVLVQAFPSTEAVRLRNALLFDVRASSSADWTPGNVPDTFMLERSRTPRLIAEAAGAIAAKSAGSDIDLARDLVRHLTAHAIRGGRIDSFDVQEIYRSIVTDGNGYCADVVDAFLALAHSVGLFARPWAFSFDGFGGHGHIVVEVYDRQERRWVMLDVFNNVLATEAESGRLLSVAEFRRVFLSDRGGVMFRPISPGIQRIPVYSRLVDYYERGIDQWYQWNGNNVIGRGDHPLVRAAAHVREEAAELMSLALGRYPSIVPIGTNGNRDAIQQMLALRWRLHMSLYAGIALTVLLFFELALLARTRRSVRSVDRHRFVGAASAGGQPLATAPMARPSVLVISSLFPSAKRPLAGIFIKERMGRVAAHLPVTVISPQPWFPLQAVLRLKWPNYRAELSYRERLDGIDILRPRFLAIPAMFRFLDGLFMALSLLTVVRRLHGEGRADILDAHFLYPDGCAASWVGRWLGLPVTITLRGTEQRHATQRTLRPQLRHALRHASKVFAVSDSLRRIALELGTPSSRSRTIGNGVDIERFHRLPVPEVRRQLGLPQDAQVLISVGGLVERKGFHRVIECLPALRRTFPQLHYLIVGGSSPEGDCSAQLREQVARLGLEACVHFLGPLPQDQLCKPLSAADVFVLATRNEGWANVFLEAMACGLPVVTTRVGGNAEVVCQPELGIVVPFDDGDALRDALAQALAQPWDRSAIRRYAERNSWPGRISDLVGEFHAIAAGAVSDRDLWSVGPQP